jgi:hypothetical protein
MAGPQFSDLTDGAAHGILMTLTTGLSVVNGAESVFYFVRLTKGVPVLVMLVLLNKTICVVTEVGRRLFSRRAFFRLRTAWTGWLTSIGIRRTRPVLCLKRKVTSVERIAAFAINAESATRSEFRIVGFFHNYPGARNLVSLWSIRTVRTLAAYYVDRHGYSNHEKHTDQNSQMFHFYLPVNRFNFSPNQASEDSFSVSAK